MPWRVLKRPPSAADDANGVAAIGHPLRLTWLRAGAGGAMTLAPALAAAALWLVASPADVSPLLVLAFAVALAAAAWALVDFEHFVLVAVLGAMAFPHALARPAGALVAAADLLLLVALAVWLVRAALRRGPPPFVADNQLLAPTVCFAAVVALSLGWSIDRAATAKGALQIVEMVIVITLLFASAPRTLTAIRRAFTAYVLVTSGLAVFAVVTFAGRAVEGDYSPLYVAGLHKNALGSFLGVGLVLAFALSLDRTRSARFRAWMRVAAVVEVAGLTGTISRGAAVGAIAAALIVSVLLRRERLRTLLVIALAAMAVVAVAQRAGAQRAEAGGYSSSSVRHLSWADGIEKIKQHPVLGTGASTYWADLDEINIGLPDPNNIFLLTWAELGLAGLAALLFLIWRYARMFAAARRLSDEARVLALAAGGGALSFLVHFQFDVTWTRGSASMCFALLGVMAAAVRLAPAQAPRAASASPIAEPTPRGPAHRPFALRAASPSLVPAAERPLRVVHLLSSDGYAGIERHVLRLARLLRERGADCQIACPPTATRLRAEARMAGVPVVPGPTPHRGAWLPRLVERLAADRPDVVHVHDGAAAVWGWRLASLAPVRLVRSQHFIQPASAWRSGWRRRGSLLLHRSLNADVDALVAVSEAVAASVRARRDARDDVVTVIPPGIDVPPEEAVAAAAARRASLPNPVVAYVGRFEAEKSLPLLLDAVPHVLEQVPRCRFVLAGSGSLERELRAQAARLGIEHALEWTGLVPEAAAVLARAHVFVNPAAAEPFGLAVAEAMSFALPVVAQASGASVELVEDGVTGLLVSRPEPVELAATLARLATDRELAARMGARARRRACERFGVERTVELTLALYEELVRR